MKAIVRNVLLACIISTFAFFGVIAPRTVKAAGASEIQPKSYFGVTERQKETLTLLGVAGLAWVLCIWRCGILYKRMNEERELRQRFNTYMYTRGDNYNRH